MAPRRRLEPAHEPRARPAVPETQDVRHHRTGAEMHIREAFSIALRSLRANRLRSALTTLGIIIGVSAVIVLVGLGDGIKAGFNTQFGALADQIIVTKLNVAVPGNGAPRDLKDGDVTALRNISAAPDIASVTPVVNGS